MILHSEFYLAKSSKYLGLTVFYWANIRDLGRRRARADTEDFNIYNVSNYVYSKLENNKRSVLFSVYMSLEIAHVYSAS